ncbi:hypothetical protein KGB38_gp20 [Salmonella phage vB_SenS_SB28]|uniref:Uncharacterized protein n=1 Tax=Salmonella phage vB_SenS_SB28 TaxID=2591136 RepID=A0A5J6TA98_9CAUD|nr:hypothetical protein KGB38_gp20 [Salmonella phage vB_SenS_SB28]QFG07761.1 hypothetical protein [Salmonella phage vB_SenS_SB28]
MQYKEIAARYQKEARDVMEILNVREDTIKFVEAAMRSLALEAEVAGREKADELISALVYDSTSNG